ncbi:MAG TPA: hypothetical protein VGB46_00135 [Flavisolibacter sp.]|jgi:hypothetical protein
MNWTAIIGMASTFALLLPVCLVLIYRLYTNRSLQALLLYYLLTAAYNLMVQDILPASTNIKIIFGTVNNYLDAPLMLLFLLFFCVEKWKIKAIYITLAAFVAYELVIALVFGFSKEANVYILGPGIIVVLLFSTVLFVRQIKRTIVMGKGLGKTLMLTSVVFSYGCFGLIYLFHYIQRTRNIGDIFLLYFISSFISSVLMAMGVALVRQHLRDLREIKLARRELQVFFNNPVAMKRKPTHIP